MRDPPDRIRTCDLRFRSPIRPGHDIALYTAISGEIALLTRDFRIHRSAPLDTASDPFSPFSEQRDRGARERNGNGFFINGEQFDHHGVNEHARLDDTEEWRIKNVSEEQDPFHIYINDFQVGSIKDNGMMGLTGSASPEERTGPGRPR